MFHRLYFTTCRWQHTHIISHSMYNHDDNHYHHSMYYPFNHSITNCLFTTSHCPVLYRPSLTPNSSTHHHHQAQGGVGGLYDGAVVVLGPDSGLMAPEPEQQFINQKMRPGSGVLSVQVLPDGPTRVLQVRGREPMGTNRNIRNIH